MRGRWALFDVFGPLVYYASQTAVLTTGSTFLLHLKNNRCLLLILFLRYTLDLSDIQMVVCKVKDKWSEVASKPFTTSDVHVVDKFTIAIQMER